MLTDSQESYKRPRHFTELEALLEEKNLEHQQSSLDGKHEPSLKRRAVWKKLCEAEAFTNKEEPVLRRQRVLPSVAKKPACYTQQDCNLIKDTCCLFFPAHAIVVFCCFIFSEGGLHRNYIENTRMGD